MRKNYTARRRGTSIAAAALSLALVAPFAQPVVSPASAPAAVAQTASDAGRNSAPINIDAIESGVITNANQLSDGQTTAKNIVSGRFHETVKKGGGQLTSTYDGFPGVEQRTVYFQWIDTDGAVSPIYEAKTHNGLEGVAGTGGDGVYAFDVPTWTDASGKEHHFETKSSESFRVWSESYTHPETGNPMTIMRTAPGLQGGIFSTGSGSGTGEFPGSVGVESNMQRTGVWTYEQPGDYMKASEILNPDSQPLKLPGSDTVDGHKPISGHVWLEAKNLITTRSKVLLPPARSMRMGTRSSPPF